MIDAKTMSRQLVEDAVDDAQFLVAHAASKCERYIDAETIRTLVNAKHIIDDKQKWTAKMEAEFWVAYQAIWELVKPVTADSIKANLPLESTLVNGLISSIPLIGVRFAKTSISRARRTVNIFIFFTVLVLILLLTLQIYWVIGSQLTTQLADLLQRETELSLEINKNQEAYTDIEIRYKQDEIDSETFQTNGAYTFYSSPNWARDTLELVFAKARLESDLASLKTQLERNSAILVVWSDPWAWLIREGVEENYSADTDQYASELASIERQIKDLDTQLADETRSSGSKKIQEAKNQLLDLQGQLAPLETNPESNADQILSLRVQVETLTAWVNQPGLVDQIISQLIQDKERLEAQKVSLERQRQGDLNREASRQARLAAQFVLVILQSYLLPLLYGILGAETSVLRSLSREIESVTYSEKAGVQHLLRISLGALAGIMVGWFSFLLPNETVSFFGSVSPLAIAFVVGYNIELFFSLMDAAIHWVNERREKTLSSGASSSSTNDTRMSSKQTHSISVNTNLREEETLITNSPPASDETGKEAPASE